MAGQFPPEFLDQIFKQAEAPGVGAMTGSGEGSSAASAGGDYWTNLKQDPNYSDMPDRPSFIQDYDPNSMSLFNMEAPGINAIDTSGINDAMSAYRQNALRTGPSQWANLATKESNLEQKQAQDQAMDNARGQTATARADLAMHGGLDSGARERLARSGQTAAIDASQKIAGQGIQNRMQIGMNDEQNRISQLGALPGMEVQALAPQFQKQNMLNQAMGTDVAHEIGENEAQNLFNMQNYHEQMSAWGANRQANATENSGKK